MEAREHWQSLQSRLAAARKSLERGDRAQALADVDAALAIDPKFLAAISLREQILAAPAPAALNPEPAIPGPLPAAPAPLVSSDGYARFEQRARRRRVDRKVDQARQAIAERRLREAAAALNEVIELDPNLPELAPLTASFDDLRRGRRAKRHPGPALAAAAVFGVVIFGATWFHQGTLLLSRPMSAIAGLVEPAEPEPIVLPAVTDATPVATTGSPDPLPAPEPERAPPAVEPRRTAVAPPPVDPSPAPRTFAPAPTPAVAPTTITASAPPPARTAPPPPTYTAPPPANPVVTMPPISTASAAPTGAPTTAAAAINPAVNVPKPAPVAPAPTENAESQISRALQQYRSAYEDLDATRARAVWPAVNEAALARAFDSLESQTLTFEGCRFDVHGDEAVARCHGSARYVPKIGSREPRTEPRSWTFALRKAGAEWKIESARAER